MALVIAVAVSPAKAANEGQIAGGDIYRVKNVTKGSDFANTANADKCDTLQYKVRLHNPGPGIVHQVHVKATLPSGEATSNTSTVTITAADADPASVSDTAVVNLSSPQSISFASGTTQLLDANNNLLQGLPDGITAGGVDIGQVGVSLNEIRFVQFQAKVSCTQQPPAQPTYACTNLDVQTGEDRTVKITSFTTSQTNGAAFTTAVIDWGDTSANLTTANPVGQTHTYTKDGTYTIQATAHFNVNGQDVTSGGVACSKVVTFKTKETPTVTPPTTTTKQQEQQQQAAPAAQAVQTQPASAPTTLVNTGPGEIVALFAVTSILGTFGYRRLILGSTPNSDEAQ
jgi:hypothetical protein